MLTTVGSAGTASEDAAPRAGSDTGGASGSSPVSAALLNSDFEADAVDMAPTAELWSTTLPTDYDSGGVVSVVDDVAHSGSQSVYVKRGSNGATHLQVSAPVFPFAGSTLYVRTWLRIPEWPSNHVSWIELGSAANDENELRIGAHLGAMQVNWYRPSGEPDQRDPDFTLEPMTWHCIEFMLDVDSPLLKVWINGENAPNLTVTDWALGGENGSGTMPIPEWSVPLEALRFGAEIAAPEVWFDDIVVATEPIGCD